MVINVTILPNGDILSDIDGCVDASCKDLIARLKSYLDLADAKVDSADKYLEETESERIYNTN